MSCSLAQRPAYWAVPLLAALQGGCGLILGLDEYSRQDACSISDCGVFVALEGSDTNDGRKERPVRTVARAIDLAAEFGGVVHLCAEEFPEAIVVPSGVSLEGGLNCAKNWEYIGELARSTLAPGSDLVPIRLLSGDAITRLKDIDARAADSSVAGGSSVALIAAGVTAEMSNCNFSAGKGAPGDKGETPVENVGSVTDPDDPSVRGVNGADACSGGVDGNPGGAETVNPLCPESIGGKGGKGAIAIGGDGADGLPAIDPLTGKAGVGDVNAGCTPGGYGVDGAAGLRGLGATAIGAVDDQGFHGASGAAGGRGATGQGGGGGGGGKGKVGCYGPSGGGGGAGGCGGYGGMGGMAGGSSIVIVSINSTLTFSGARLTAADGGTGGDGADGAIGGIGGNGGWAGTLMMGTTKACAGGDGGFGGLGGQGGGGRGGHSLGIAFSGKVPLLPANTIVVLGQPGPGGAGADDAGRGANGEAVATLEFPPPP